MIELAVYAKLADAIARVELAELFPLKIRTKMACHDPTTGALGTAKMNQYLSNCNRVIS